MIDEFVKNCNLSDIQLKTLLESNEFDNQLKEAGRQASAGKL